MLRVYGRSRKALVLACFISTAPYQGPATYLGQEGYVGCATSEQELEYSGRVASLVRSAAPAHKAELVTPQPYAFARTNYLPAIFQDSYSQIAGKS